jgi:hypothetical protein
MAFSVIVLKGADNLHNQVAQFKARNLKDAEGLFKYQTEMLKWSKQHREKVGLSPNDDAIVWLFDHDCGYELREEAV